MRAPVLLLVAVLAEVTFRPAGTPDPAPAVPKGPRLSVSDFKYNRPFDPGSSGWKKLKLDAAALAGSQGYTDYRIVDTEGFQVPYVLEGASEPVRIELLALSDAGDERRAARLGDWSVYRVEVPFRELPPSRLKLTAADPVFERRVVVRVPRHHANQEGPFTDEETRIVAEENYSHRDNEEPPRALVLSLPRLRSPLLFVDVDEGDNQPLRFKRPELELDGYTLRFYSQEPGTLQLLYGSSRIGPPRYDMAILGSGVPDAEEISLSETGAITSETESFWNSDVLLWVVLTGAVIALLALIVKLVKPEKVAS